MKKKVKIFIAGAKALKSERNGLKALAQELNTRYNDQGVDIFIEMKSYEEFKDRQDEYENYLKKSADMALFVLDSRIGQYTKQEFITAVDAYKKKQIPEIIVFLKNYDQETEEIKEILSMMNDYMGIHFFFVGYDDVDDLKFKAEKRITQYISPTDHTRSMKRWRMATVAVAAILTFTLLSSTLWPSKEKTNSPNFEKDTKALLFLGGGSVTQYLTERYKIDVTGIYKKEDANKGTDLIEIPNAIRPLQESLADRTVLQVAQATPQDQEILGYN